MTEKRVFRRVSRQMSESIEVGILLALAGGFMDAYSYICRDGVFANAQTGNILLTGIHLSQGEWQQAVRFIIPVCAFVMGIAIADIFRLKLKEMSLLHWRQLGLLVEAVILFAVSFFTQEQNLLANSLTSLACGIQVESFRKIHGNGMATTMCIGNLRSATQNICEYWETRNQKTLKKGLLYFGIIICFVIGAVLGNQCVILLGEAAIRISAGILLAAFLLMFVKPKDTRRKDVR